MQTFFDKEQLIISLLELSKVPEPAEAACVSNIAFYGAITMIYGEPKLGKSFTVGEALNGSSGFFIDIDSNGHELHEHLIKNHLTPLHGVEAKPFLDLIMCYEGTERFIIIIDSFTNLSDELGFNINDTKDMTRLFKQLRKITDKGHAVILIHHVTTNAKDTKDKDYSSKIQGNAGAILGRVDVIYYLEERGLLKRYRTRIANAAETFVGGGATIYSAIIYGKTEIPA